jgi:adenylosuccinate synthase
LAFETDKMKVDVLLGLQWGDEGKGKVVDVLTPHYDVIARFQGGPNAGHTLIFDGVKHVLHTIPSGIFRPDALNVVGNGVVIDPVIFQREMRALADRGIAAAERLRISRKAHLILPTHRMLDAANEHVKGKARIGSTLKGIGPTYMDKTGRNGLRVGDLESPRFAERYGALRKKHLDLLAGMDTAGMPEFDLEAAEREWLEAVDFLRTLELGDTEGLLHEGLRTGKRILAEGAQGTMLDIDFGTYPFVTSSSTVAAGACTGLGIAPNRIGEVIGIFKAYCTRVGAGPFPTELDDETGERMRTLGGEFGSTTGRARRCGWLDLAQLRYAVDVNGVTQLAMMKADVLGTFETIRVCTHYVQPDGTPVEGFPYDLDPEFIRPVYVDLPGWNCDLTGLQHADEMPEALRRYIAFIEAAVHVPVTLLSVGPDRGQTLHLTPIYA